MSARPTITLASVLITSLLGICLTPVQAATPDHWFETLKDNATDRELHRFLYNMPKGGDLHNHLAGAIHPVSYTHLTLPTKA